MVFKKVRNLLFFWGCYFQVNHANPLVGLGQEITPGLVQRVLQWLGYEAHPVAET